MTATDVLLFSNDDRREFERLRAGDAVAFEQVFRTHYEPLVGLARRYVRSTAIAEELVDDVFAKVWIERGRLPTSGSIRRYLSVATRNRAISALRHDIVEQQYTLNDGWRAALPMTEAVNDAARDLEHSDVRMAVRAALAGLPARCRLALELRWERQLTRAEIAQAMGISIKTLEVYLTRGAKALRAKYTELFGD